jgi:hypothetical protein
MKTKKELKEEYKLVKPKIGVYRVRNTANNKVFIDSSINLGSIWNRHRVTLNNGTFHNAALQQEWNQLGEACFVYEVVAEIKHDETKNIDYQKEAALLAAMYIDELQPFDDEGYNKRKPGQ